MFGYNQANADVEKRDIVNNAYLKEFGPPDLWGDLTLGGFVDNQGNEIYDGELGPEDRSLDNAVLTYMWEDQTLDQTRDEFKIELNYLFKHKPGHAE